jgi:hypothetical protein
MTNHWQQQVQGVLSGIFELTHPMLTICNIEVPWNSSEGKKRELGEWFRPFVENIFFWNICKLILNR